MKGLRAFFVALTVCIATVFAAQPAYVQSTKGDSTHWTGLNWTADDTALFGGAPVYRGKDTHLILVRYHFFVSEYDVDQLSPLWVAHVDEQDSVLKDRGRKTGAWGRKDDHFEPDANVAAYSKSLGLPFVTDASYTNANPPGLPVDAKGYFKITRGHMASNQEMKSLGDQAAGLESQKQSFSLANVVPQMQHNNAPIWAKLEDDCLQWAEKLGRVAVISGPVFAPDPALPLPANKVLFTEGKDGVRIPIPTHFFKIIIGKIDGKVAAVGFLVPHRADLSIADLKKCVVPIRQIETLAKLDFMPASGANDAMETTVDERWLGSAQ